MVCGLHQILVDGMFVYVASVDIINIFYNGLLIYVGNIVILLDVKVSLSWYLPFEVFVY
jgi:hypothetical protein